MKRAHLIFNPEARRVTPALVRVVLAALETRYKLDSTFTRAPDAGIEVARRAAEDGNEVIVAFGGDGLVNEVVNGIAGTPACLAVIPGGTMNVFARNMGIPRDPLQAADRLLARGNDPVRFKPAKVDDRYFLFACGCGFDAEAAGRVESNKPVKRRIGEPYFYMAAMTTFLGHYFAKKPFLRVSIDGKQLEGVLAITLNGDTYAYLAGRPVRLGKHVHDAGPAPADDKQTAHGAIKVFTLEKLRYWRIPNYLLGAVLTGEFGPDAQVTQSYNPVTIAADAPFPIHVDGEPLEPRSRTQLNAGDVEISLLI